MHYLLQSLINIHDFCTIFHVIKMSNNHSLQIINILEVGCGDGKFARLLIAYLNELYPNIKIFIHGIDHSNSKGNPSVNLVSSELFLC